MKTVNKPRSSDVWLNQLQNFIASKPGGFLKDTDLPELTRIDRLCPVLVRCGGCRFTCGAQDAARIIQAIERDGDYVRDVSFPVGSSERAALWQPECPITPVAMLPQSFAQPRAKARPDRFNDCEDYGGVFDGHQVTSDADPGL